ncbi:MAG: DUF2851 family protein, partial [Bacteroidota bacterium]
TRLNLVLESGESVRVVKQGNYQTNAGPDFENGEIMIGGIRLLGNIEIHIKSSDWFLHQHHTDVRYNNVILHVVWEHDQEVVDSSGHQLPVLTLKDRISPAVKSNYEQLIESRQDILCSEYLPTFPELKKIEWMDKAIISRMKEKADRELRRLQENDGDWEETSYQLLLRNFGFKINSEAFVSLGEALPFKIVKKHIDHTEQLEALFYGQAGLLHDAPGNYAQKLFAEHQFLAHKYKLPAVEQHQLGWKFLRSRPANFPTVRIAQLIAVLQQMPHLFDSLVAEVELKERYRQFQVTVSSYWQQHYDFEKRYTSRNILRIGRQSIDQLMVNTIVPLLAAYAQHLGQQKYMDQAIALMEAIKPEDNFITRKWKAAGVCAKSALDSQALIMQYNQFCSLKKCLECTVGLQLVRE